MRNSRGFTLVETLLVMAIIAIIASAVMLTLPSSNQDDNKSRDLALTLRYQFSVAREYAMLTQRPVGLYANEEEQLLEFVEWYDKQWQPLRKKGLKPQTLRDTQWHFERNGGFAVMKNEAQQDDFLINDEENDEGSEDEDAPIQPQVFILPSGEVGDFSLSLQHIDSLDPVYLETASPWQLTVTTETPYEG